MEEKNYRVLRIEEQLYGCEELPEGQPVLCDVLLEAADGTQRVLPYPDAELTRLDINEGSTVTLRDHRLACLLYTSPSPRDRTRSRMPSSA